MYTVALMATVYIPPPTARPIPATNHLLAHPVNVWGRFAADRRTEICENFMSKSEANDFSDRMLAASVDIFVGLNYRQREISLRGSGDTFCGISTRKS